MESLLDPQFRIHKNLKCCISLNIIAIKSYHLVLV